MHNIIFILILFCILYQNLINFLFLLLGTQVLKMNKIANVNNYLK